MHSRQCRALKSQTRKNFTGVFFLSLQMVSFKWLLVPLYDSVQFSATRRRRQGLLSKTTKLQDTRERSSSPYRSIIPTFQQCSFPVARHRISCQYNGPGKASKAARYANVAHEFCEKAPGVLAWLQQAQNSGGNENESQPQNDGSILFELLGKGRTVFAS